MPKKVSSEEIEMKIKLSWRDSILKLNLLIFLYIL